MGGALVSGLLAAGLWILIYRLRHDTGTAVPAVVS